jgi:hypothetical protein
VELFYPAEDKTAQTRDAQKRKPPMAFAGKHEKCSCQFSIISPPRCCQVVTFDPDQGPYPAWLRLG